MNKHALGSMLCLILWGGVLGLTTAFAQQLKPASPSQTSAQQMNIASAPTAATHAVASPPITPTESLTTAWNHSCVSQRMIITGIGMGDPTQAINPQTMTLADPNSVAGLRVQVAGRRCGNSPVPEWVALTTDTQTLTLTKIYNPPHAYTFEADLQPSRHITALVSNTGNDYKTPRGLILYSLRNTNGEWSSVGKTMSEFVYKRTHTETLILPEPLGQPTDVEVTAVVIDNDNDDRFLVLTATAGSAVTTSGAITKPTDGPLLNIIPLTLSQVPTHTDRITITLQSPQQNGDSLVLVGLNVSYPCSGGSADLEITKTVEITALNESELITYTVTVTNHGPSHATGVSVTDQLPGGLIYGGYTATRGIFTRATGLWKVGDLENMGTASLIITATTNKCSGSSIVNTAVVTAAIDSNPDNNKATASVNSAVAAYCIYLPIICKAPPPPCYTETFTDSHSPLHWDIKPGPPTLLQYLDGTYHIRTINTPGVHWARSPLGPYRSYSVQVEAGWVNTNTNIAREYGIVFDLSNNLTMYRFNINTKNSTYVLGRLQGTWTTLVSGSSSIISTGTYTNTLKVERKGNNIDMYINGQFVASYTENNPLPQPAFIGVNIVRSSVDGEAYFDNFTICSYELNGANINNFDFSLTSGVANEP
jgi:uncharacterized repeat protein (TIGR01451 family)